MEQHTYSIMHEVEDPGRWCLILKKSNSLLILILFCLFLANTSFAQTAASFAADGQRLLAERKLDEAVTAFRRSLQLDAKKPETHTSLGVALALLRKYDEALISFREAVRLAPASPEIRLNLCKGLTDSQKHSEALEQCREAVRLAPGSARAIAMLADNLRVLQRTDEALVILTTALQRLNNERSLLHLSAEISMEAGDFYAALPKYETLASLYPNEAGYQAMLANCYLRVERDREAVNAANKAIELQPANSMAHFYLGKVHFEMGQNEEALTAFSRAAALDPKFVEAFHFLGLTQDRLGRLVEAASSMKTAATLDPDSAYYNYALGKVLCENARFQEAVAPLRKANQLEQDNFGFKTQLGLALFESANFDEALTVLAEADKLRPNDPIVKMFLQVTTARKNNGNNLAVIEKLARDNPKDVKLKLNLAQTYDHLRRTNEAEPLYLEVIRLQPDDAKLYNLLGVFYSGSGQNEKAANAYRKAGELMGHHVPYLSLGNSLNKLGRNAEALEAYKKAYSIKPDSAAVLKLYADVLKDAGKRQEAITLYRSLLAIEPSNVAALSSLGYLYIKTNNSVGAKECYEMLKLINPAEARAFARCLRYHAFL